MLAEGADRVLGWRSPHSCTRPRGRRTCLLLKNYQLSDDIAFRFSNRGWTSWPLTAEKFASWLHAVNGGGEAINLFMDYETFGEHQWAETGIFEFMRRLPRPCSRSATRLRTPSELIARCHAARTSSTCRDFVSWADTERDLSAWLGNAMQSSALTSLFALRDEVRASGDPQALEDFRRLTTSDHFYYMCTKYFADGDVHKYFSPYESPYDAYINFMNVLSDLAGRIGRGGLRAAA